MVECEECGKKLGIMEGYRHPVMGKKHLLCSPCFDQISESVATWAEFVQTNSLNVKALKNNLRLNWREITPSVNQIQEIFDNLGSENLVNTEK